MTNNTINLENVTLDLVTPDELYNTCRPIAEEFIKDNCRAWEGRTYDSHFLYMKFIVLFFIVRGIKYFWNPYIDFSVPFEFRGKKYKIDIMKGYLMNEILEFIVVVWLLMTLQIFYIEHVIIRGMSIIDAFKYIFKSSTYVVFRYV